MSITTTYSAKEVCDLAGISYRQLDYWTRSGLVSCLDRSSNKSGVVRQWPEDQVKDIIIKANRARELIEELRLLGFDMLRGSRLQKGVARITR